MSYTTFMQHSALVGRCARCSYGFGMAPFYITVQAGSLLIGFRRSVQLTLHPRV
jgi:hypothetical protein